MSMTLVWGWLALAGIAAVSSACEDSCLETGNDHFTCTCTATCPTNGQQVSSHTEGCFDNSGDAGDRAKDNCASELSACGDISCSCNCKEDTAIDCRNSAPACH